MVSRFTQRKFVRYPTLYQLEEHSLICGATNLRRLLVICGTEIHINKKKSGLASLTVLKKRHQNFLFVVLKMIYQ